MIWTREQAKSLVDRTLALSKAEHTTVAIDGSERASVRFARNSVSTAGATADVGLAITARFGKRSGTVTTARFDDASLQTALRNAEEIAQASPENPEAMPLLGPQQYASSSAYFDDAASATPEWRASSVAMAIDLAKKKDVVTAGFVETQAAMRTVANSAGLFAYDRYTAAAYNLTARLPDGSGSGWASKAYNQLSLLRPDVLAETAISKAASARNPTGIEPGVYTVVLEPAAVADMVAYMFFSAAARQADEGRSAFAKRGGGNRIGDTIVGENVRIYTDPSHPLAPTMSFDGEGLPTEKRVWVDKGVLQNLMYTRFWAEKMGKAPTASPSNLIMDGGTETVSDLIAGTRRGLLVTRFWYIRPLDPQTLLLTGLTRDGLFLIEDGKVTRPVKNMRWNESPIVALSNVDAMTAPERVVSGEGIGASGVSLVCPAARIREFRFSSGSDAV